MRFLGGEMQGAVLPNARSGAARPSEREFGNVLKYDRAGKEEKG